MEVTSTTKFVFTVKVTMQQTRQGRSKQRRIKQQENLHKKKIQQDATVYQSFISYLYEAQHVSGGTPPIIRSLKLH